MLGGNESIMWCPLFLWSWWCGSKEIKENYSVFIFILNIFCFRFLSLKFSLLNDIKLCELFIVVVVLFLFLAAI